MPNINQEKIIAIMNSKTVAKKKKKKIENLTNNISIIEQTINSLKLDQNYGFLNRVKKFWLEKYLTVKLLNITK